MAREASESEFESFAFDAPSAKVVRGPHSMLLQVGSLCFEISGPECDMCGEEIDWTLAFARVLRRGFSGTEILDGEKETAQ